MTPRTLVSRISRFFEGTGGSISTPSGDARGKMRRNVGQDHDCESR